MKKDFWAVEWSQRSEQFHIDRLNAALSDLVRSGKEPDWKIIAVVKSSDDAHRLTKRLREDKVNLSAW